tara:strand:+ start:77 stop:346 length:270 start_codon:yes stop_codon:yes gene_type:complete
MRNIELIIVEMFDVLNKYNNTESEKYIGFKRTLISLRDSIFYSAPELLKTNWFFNKLGINVNFYIKENDYNNIQWCKEIVDIFINKNVN